jgi:hypothetical protein
MPPASFYKMYDSFSDAPCTDPCDRPCCTKPCTKACCVPTTTQCVESFGTQDRDTHNMNYYLLLIFHSDVDRRPCRPVLRVVHLADPPHTNRHNILKHPRGQEMLVTCQLCDQCVAGFNDGSCALSVDLKKVLRVCALSLTDTEAGEMIQNVADVNTLVASRRLSFSHRSNIPLLPRVLHNVFRMGARCLFDLCDTYTATDVQVSVMLVRESVNKARSLAIRLNALHPYLATPENLHDAVENYTRQLDLFAFKAGAFTFCAI